MHIPKIILLLGLSLTFISCASAPKQTDAFLKAPRTIPDRTRLASVPFIKQTANYCGPASLAMVMNWAGVQTEMQELAKKTYTPGQTGTLQSDMLGAARRNGLMTIPVRGISDLLNEVAAGHPVIVLQNLGFAVLPKWHYAVAVGYDLDTVKLIMHSGPDRFDQMSLRDFEPTWALANYWGLAVLPPGQLSVTGDELDHTNAAAVLENLGDYTSAEKIYKAVLTRWKNALTAYIGLGNTRYALRDYRGSVAYLKTGAELHPTSAVVWHNLATAQGSAGMKSAAKASALKAISLTPDEATRKAYEVELRALIN